MDEWEVDSDDVGTEIVFDEKDIQDNKVMAGLSYLLFFLPLIACPKSAFARYHANQALLLFILSVVGSMVLGIIPVIGWLIMPLFYIFVMVLGIMGLLNGLGGKVKEIPVIGKYKLLS